MENQLTHYKNIWKFKLTDKDGKVLFEDSGPNNLTNKGQEWIMTSAFKKDNSTDRLWIRLANQSLTKDDVLTAISTEPVGNGYAPQELTRDSTGFVAIVTIDANSVLQSKEVSITATGGNIGPISVAFLATSDNSEIPDTAGTLLAFRDLPIIQTILSGNTGTIYMQITLA